MVQSLIKPIDFDTLLDGYPETSKRYELHDGMIIEMPKPSGSHSNLAGFLIEELFLVVLQMGKRGQWTIPKKAIVKANQGKSGYKPDVIVLEQAALKAEPRWAKDSVIENAMSVKLIAEVVSTNWRDDYFKKRADYEEMGIPEYWIVDYGALGGRNFLGSPKQPTLFVHQLVEDEYQVRAFRDNETIVSPTFPELKLTLNAMIQASSCSDE
ncbi:MAG: Uma2 family endonuclease [Spirulina sp. SIO3F2]|nr:Uma2 family endonuclease [Spirulina sp. SIO3F2]